MASLFSIQDLNASLGNTAILHGITFTVEKGEFIGLVGPNGSGKTTLLRVLAGLLPYKGSALFQDIELSTWSTRDLARLLAFLRQQAEVSFAFTVREIVAIGRLPHQSWLGRPSKSDEAAIDHALAHVDLTAFAARPFLSLSGGERQRVFLAQALAQQAQVLLLDEPTNHLDIHHRFSFLETIQRLETPRPTVITAFHDLDLAFRFCDRVLVFDKGRLLITGQPSDVLVPDLIREIFRMEAQLIGHTDGPSIYFQRPTSS